MIGALKRNACFASSGGVERLFSVLRRPVEDYDPVRIPRIPRTAARNSRYSAAR